MIQIRQMKTSDKQSLLNMLTKEGLDIEKVFESDKSYFVIEDMEEIVGFSSYEIMNNEQARLLNIFIRKHDRGFKLGDGLLRGVLNQLDRLKIKKVFIFSTPKTNEFYISEGLEIANELNAVLKDKTFSKDNGDLVFYVELPDFFTKPCKSSLKMS